jgi:hypothetical protein
MTISWYSPKPKQTAEVKVTKSSIVLTMTGMEKLASIDAQFIDATSVKLGWDADRNLVAIAPAQDGEKGVFKVGRRGRSQGNRTINAAKFFDLFGLVPDDASPNIPVLSDEGGIATFKLNVRGVANAGAAAPVRKRRGRVPKALTQ